ncbi:MAG: porin [Methylomonas lenta]|nr:porin [Methylomonas lenta]
MKKILPSLITGSLVLTAVNVLADDAAINSDQRYSHEAMDALTDDAGAIESLTDAGAIKSLTGYNVNESALTKSTGIEFGGWASGGVSYASNNNSSHSNSPISFNDRINEFQFNQLNLFMEKAVEKGDSWDFGGRADWMYGMDSTKTQALGWDNKIMVEDKSSYYSVAFPQAYAEIYAPFGNGITAKVGHFYTLIGYEVVTSPDNFFYSHAYTMLYGEPFTHTGALLSYDINDMVSVTGGAVMGWDNFRESPGAWDFLGSVSVKPDDDTSIVTSLITGDTLFGGVLRNTTMYSIVLSHDFTDKLHYVAQHDYGVAQGTPNDNQADWYGINQYLTYDINDKLAAGLRAEWFRDADGYRTGFNGSFYAVSAGVNYKPVSWFKLRPELRYDNFAADSNVAAVEKTPFDIGSENDQIGVAMDMIVTF